MRNSMNSPTSRGAPTGHKLFNFTSFSFQSPWWAHIKRSADEIEDHYYHPMKPAILALLLFVAAVGASAADKQPIPSEHIYGPLLGKRVKLDVLVWHYTKGISGRVLLPSGDSVYVREPWIHRSDGTLEPRLPNGKLVRLVGVLTAEHVAPAPPGAQGYTQAFSYFALALESFTIIDRAEQESPKLNPK